MDRVSTVFLFLKSMGKLPTQSMDRVYTVFLLLESMGELLTHSQQIGFIQLFAS